LSASRFATLALHAVDHVVHGAACSSGRSSTDTATTEHRA
jgi:hypothetical protein